MQAHIPGILSDLSTLWPGCAQNHWQFGVAQDLDVCSDGIASPRNLL